MEMKHWVIITGITFVVFFAEAVVHYNYGIRKTLDLPLTLKNFQIPQGKDLYKMGAIVIVASTLSGGLISFAEKRM